MTKKYCQLWLTCTDEKEAAKITDTLLAAQLVACVHQLPVNSSFCWQSKIKKSDEVLLVMESRQDLFTEVEHEVSKLHSYDTFVLKSVPIDDISKKAEGWLKKELKNA